VSQEKRGKGKEGKRKIPRPTRLGLILRELTITKKKKKKGGCPAGRGGGKDHFSCHERSLLELEEAYKLRGARSLLSGKKKNGLPRPMQEKKKNWTKAFDAGRGGKEPESIFLLLQRIKGEKKGKKPDKALQESRKGGKSGLSGKREEKKRTRYLTFLSGPKGGEGGVFLVKH